VNKSHIAKNSIYWSLIQQFSTQSIGFIVAVVMARLILPSDFGLMGLVYIYIAIGTVLIDGGLTHSLIRTQNPDDEDYSTVFFLNLLISVLFYFILYFSAPYISDFYKEKLLTNIIRIYSLTFIISSFSVIQNTILVKNLKFKTIFLINLPSLFISSIVGIILAIYGYGVWSLVWSGIVKSVLLTLQLWYYGQWKLIYIFKWEKFKYHFNFGYKIALMEVINSIYANIFQLFIGKFFSISKVGYFTQANTLRQIPVANIYGAVNNVAYPLLVKNSHDNNKILLIYKKLLIMMVYVITPLLVYLCVFGEPILRFLFTDKWLPALPYLKILCFAGILHPLVVFNMNIFKVKGRSDLYLILGFTNKIFITLGILFSLKYGIEVLLWSLVVSYFISFLLNSYYMGKLLDYNYLKQFIDLMPVFVVSIILWIAITYLDVLMINLNFNDFFRLSTGVIISLIVYYLFSLLFKINEIKDIKKLILHRKI
jgi:O-antigen/teichoic acid export membrane protein